MDEINTTQSALNAGMHLADVRSIAGKPFVVLPDEASVRDMEEFLPAPIRKRGTVKLRDTDSFVAYVNAEKTEATRIYGNLINPHFVAVFNDHGATPAWKDYRASYACPLSVEWQTWKGQSDKQMSQEQFAQFIEDNLPDIAQPPAADMLEISRTLEAKKKVNFASGVRLSNGQTELTYEEQISGTAAKGKLVVPEEFVIGIPVLEGGPRYAVTARLRYRIGDGGRMAMWFELVRPHKILEDAVKDVCKAITEKTSIAILNGEA
jgi:uncharacterized protein YfdQ (DUF2303 family)